MTPINNIRHQFFLGQKVITPFVDEGIVRMIGFDGDGVKYIVATKGMEQWFLEVELRTHLDW